MVRMQNNSATYWQKLKRMAAVGGLERLRGKSGYELDNHRFLRGTGKQES